MVRKTKQVQSETPAAPENRDRDPNGHYDFCTVRISPEGHRPLAQCLLRVWWHQRRPMSWHTRKAVDDDHMTEHVCREWFPEEDARIRALTEQTSIERHSVTGSTAAALARVTSKLDINNPLVVDDNLPLALESAIKRPKRPPVEKVKVPSGITFDGRLADADMRKAHKVHACSNCDATIGHGMKYLESREGAKSAFKPFRYCGKCWPVLKYGLPT